MGFHAYSSPYDWSRIAGFKATATTVSGGMIDLSVGSPADPVPVSVQQVLTTGTDAANAHGYPVTAGTAELKTAIDTSFRELRGVDLQAIHAAVVPTVGSKEAVALMTSLLHCGEGDVIVQPAVSYPTYEIGTQLAGATVVKVDDVTDIDSWANIPHVKAIWVNSPCNPSGEIIGADQLADIVAAARHIGAVVLSDECYALMDWQSAHTSAAESEPRLSAAPCALSSQVCEGSVDGILVLYSLSKQSNMAGYRTALIAGDRHLVQEMAEYRKQIGQIIPGPVLWLLVCGIRLLCARSGSGIAAVCLRWLKRLLRMGIRLICLLVHYTCGYRLNPVTAGRIWPNWRPSVLFLVPANSTELPHACGSPLPPPTTP